MDTEKKTKGSKAVTLILLHLMLMVYSLGGIFSKKAAGEAFLSMGFCLNYGAVLFLLVIYAVVWQQIIKRLPLTTAYANKAVTLLWGILWGRLFFEESITFGKIAGVIIVMAGVILYSLADGEEKSNDQ